MSNIEITVHIPALDNLAATLLRITPAAGTPGATHIPAPQTSASSSIVAPVPVSSPASTTPPPMATAPAVPTAAPTAAPSYTMDQIAKAGAELAQAGKMPQLMALLQQHGVQAVTQLRPEQYGDFAAALRGLGAQL